VSAPSRLLLAYDETRLSSVGVADAVHTVLALTRELGTVFGSLLTRLPALTNTCLTFVSAGV
jgi:hypothetical protein